MAKRDLWKSNRRIYHVTELIINEALSATVHPELAEVFGVVQNFRMTLMNDSKHDFKLAVLDKRTSCFGMVIACNKWIVKDAVVQCMEEMRFLARARNIDEIWGIANDLYSWQFIHYSRQDELMGKKDFYTMSAVFPCYVKDNQYTYADKDMKLVIAMLRAVLKSCLKQQKEYV